MGPFQTWNIVSEIRNIRVLHHGSLLSVCRSVSSFVCQHNLGIESLSAPPRPLRRQTGCHNKWNGASQAAPSRGRRVLRPADNPVAIPKPKNRERMSLATCYYDVETGGSDPPIVAGDLSTVSIMIPDQLHVDAVARDFSTSRSTL